MNKKDLPKLCPCGSEKNYTVCCQLAHLGTPAKTAEALMRSRYTAFALNLKDYLLSSWHSSTRPDENSLRMDESANWLGLKVLSTDQGQEGSPVGTVEFIARYKINGKATRIKEVSEFIFESDEWFYVSAK